MQKRRKKLHKFLNDLTYGKCNHFFIWVRSEFHPIHNGSDGVERVDGHLRGLHLPLLPATPDLCWIQASVHTDMMYAVPI